MAKGKGCKSFFEFKKDVKWSDITDKLLLEYKEYLEDEGLTDNTIRCYLSEVKSILSEASMLGYQFPSTSYSKILKGKYGVVSHTYLTKNDIKTLHDFLFNFGFGSELDKAVLVKFLIGCYTGARYSDFNGMDSSNIEVVVYENSDGGAEAVNCLKYISKKTKYVTFVPLKPCVCSLLNINSTLSDVDVDTINRRIPIICEAAGITDVVTVRKLDKEFRGKKCEFIRSHSARRSFATNVFISGEYDLRDIAKFVGHKNSSTTENSYIVCPPIKRGGVINSYFD